MGWKKRAKKVLEEKAEGKRRIDARLILVGLALVAVVLFAFRGTPGGDSGGKEKPAGTTVAGEYALFKNVPSTHEAGLVQMIVFFDFYCPHCREFDTGVLPQLQAKYTSSLVVTHVGYPIFGAKAVNAIRAYELAKDYGKGEEMNTAIFTAFHVQKRDISDTEVLATIADEVGLDKVQFKKALDSGAKNEVIQRNIDLAESYNIGQTPLVVLDGQYVVTKVSPENLDSIITSILS